MIDSVNLEKIHVCFINSISNTLLDPEVKIEYNYMANRTEIMARGYVLGETQKDIVISYPENWKESLKERFAPEFIKSRWPVRMTVNTINVDVVYPNLKISIPREQHSVLISNSVSTSFEGIDNL